MPIVLTMKKMIFDDDELNEILARSEEEKVLFASMDEEKTGKVPYKSRLIEKDELPATFTEDISSF